MIYYVWIFSKKEIGHFTQFVGQDATVVGCAGSKYTDGEGQQAILVCNYGFGNMQNTYIYAAGPAASKCKTGPNPDYPALCSVDEDYTEDLKKRSAWDLKPMKTANGVSWNTPGGCDEDPTGECQRMISDPSTFFKDYLKPKGPTETKVTIGDDGSVQFQFPSDCDAACQQKAQDDFIASHPEYGK